MAALMVLLIEVMEIPYSCNETNIVKNQYIMAFLLQQQGFHVSVIISTEMMNIEKTWGF